MKPKEHAEFLYDNMEGLVLGYCLEKCRWGSKLTVMYEMNVNGIIDFIQNWMEQNPEGIYSNKERVVELPYLSYNQCPRDNSHKGTFENRKGVVRCAYFRRTKKFFRGNDFFEEEIRDYCAAVISDKNVPMSLETLIKRKNLSNRENQLVFNFDGHTLAHYVKLWEEQDESPFYE